MTNVKRKGLPNDLSFRALFAPNATYSYFEGAESHPFRHGSNKFQLVNAWWLAEASMLVYTSPEFIKPALARVGLESEFFSDERTGTQFFVAHNNRFIVVCFRGTQVEKKEDILSDAKFILVDSGQGGKVHHGFKAALDAVWSQLNNHLTEIKKRPQASQATVWFTGHSLGAALATIAAARYGNVQGVYTYGSPRVGDEVFFNRYHVNTYRFVNNNDVVPMVPPPGAYKHVGSFKYIDAEGHIVDNPDRWTRLKDAFNGHQGHLLNVLGAWKMGALETIPSDNLNDHAPIYYVVRIWNNYINDLSHA